MADDKRAPERMLEDMLMAMGRHWRDRAAYSDKGDFAGVARFEHLLNFDYSRIRAQCVEHDLELPHDVPSEGAE